MSKRYGPSLYFASDKVIFDSMNQRQVNTDLVRELLFERGIIVSSKTPKDELAHYFSRLTADYFDHKSIGQKLGKTAKHERITHVEIKDDLTPTEILDAINLVKTDLEEREAKVTLEVKTDRIVALVEYDHIDYTEVEFRQVQPKDAVIEFVRNDTGKYVVRNTQNAFIGVAVDQIFAALNKSRSTPIEKTRVSLEGYADPVLRTKFFERLIRGIDEHTYLTVKEAYCFKPKLSNSTKNTDDKTEIELEDQPYVERVTLKGNGVTKTFVVDELYKRGYYIIKVVWHVKPNASLDADVFELEAQFSRPDSCTEFSYQTRNVFLFEDGKVTEKKRSPKIAEQDALFRLVENSARKALIDLEA